MVRGRTSYCEPLPKLVRHLLIQEVGLKKVVNANLIVN